MFCGRRWAGIDSYLLEIMAIRLLLSSSFININLRLLDNTYLKVHMISLTSFGKLLKEERRGSTKTISIQKFNNVHYFSSSIALHSHE